GEPGRGGGAGRDHGVTRRTRQRRTRQRRHDSAGHDSERTRQWGHGAGRVRGQPDAAPRSAAVPAALPGRRDRPRRGPRVWAGRGGRGGVQAGRALTRRAVAAGASLVFAAGGDGTVRACAEALAGTGVPLAIVPLGTANLTARALGVPSQGGRAVEAGFGGRDHTIDLALEEGAGGTWFAAMAGIGLDAAVVAA